MAEKSRTRTVWLRCKITEGMFPDEVVVVIEPLEGQAVSFFWARRRLGAEGTIPVAVLKTEGKTSVVALPQPSLEGPSVVRVPQEALVGA